MEHLCQQRLGYRRQFLEDAKGYDWGWERCGLPAPYHIEENGLDVWVCEEHYRIRVIIEARYE
jgi:hypothetical protein